MFYICTSFLKNFHLMNALRRMLFCTVLMLSVGVAAQKHEVGVQAGMVNLVGDIGNTNFILQKPFSDVSKYGLPAYLGLMYKLNFNPYQGLRFNIGYMNVQFRDLNAKEFYRYNRGLEGTNSQYSVDAQFEYNFLPVNNEQEAMWSPYVFGGIGGIMYSARQVTLDFTGRLYEDATGNLALPVYPTDYTGVAGSQLSNTFGLSIPFGIGAKYKFNYNWALFAELKFRYNLTDGIDYSKLEERNVKVIGKVATLDGGERRLTRGELESIREPYIAGQQIGNVNSNDWVNTVALGVSYSFGRPPCYCEK